VSKKKEQTTKNKSKKTAKTACFNVYIQNTFILFMFIYEESERLYVVVILL